MGPMPRKPLPEVPFKLVLLFSDIVALILIFTLVHVFRFEHWPEFLLSNPDFLLVFFVTLASAYVFDLYNPLSETAGLHGPWRCLIAAVVSGVMISLILYLFGERAEELYGRGVLAGSLLVFAIWTGTQRFVLARWIKRRGRKIHWLIIGDYPYLEQFWADFNLHSVDGRPTLIAPEKREGEEPLPISGYYNELDQFLLKGWSAVVVCLGGRLPAGIMEKLVEVRLQGTRVFSLSDYYERVFRQVAVFYLDRSWVALSQGFALLHNAFGLRLKSLIDILLALLILPLIFPIILLAGLLILLESGWPVIYRQTRTGRDGKDFTLYKLRTMVKDAESKGVGLTTKNDPRITLLGNFLRKSRIDELPQVINVLKGDMSFIGPRPERPEFNRPLEKQIPYYSLRHVVRPGITGWAQVLGRYAVSEDEFREKLQYDLYYIKNYSFLMDVAIVLKTLRIIVLGAGR